MINVLKPGLFTTIQDYGRPGYYEIGLPPSGAIDKYSYAIGNLLVGNHENAASLEVTYMGPELEFLHDATIAITGGDIPPKVNGTVVPMWQTISVKAGDVLSFDFVKSGARVYIAVAGGIDVPIVMNSRSTYTPSAIGGLDGRTLRTGDNLKIGSLKEISVKIGAKIPSEYIPDFSNHHEIRVVIGLCSYRLTEDSMNRFLNIEWTVTPEANRIGYRFKGERLAFKPRQQPFGAGSNPSNVVDVGYPVGSIQVPDGIEPIALLNDAVTGGGYATIATVISTDLDLMAQIKINEKVHFVAVSLEDALNVRKTTRERLSTIATLITS